jgi:hypothetical protein
MWRILPLLVTPNQIIDYISLLSNQLPIEQKSSCGSRLSVGVKRLNYINNNNLVLNKNT